MPPRPVQRVSQEPSEDLSLKIPQARILSSLMPTHPDYPPSEWPLITRSQLCIRAGYTTISGTVTRVLNGIRPGNTTTGTPHPGLIERGMIEVVMVDVEGLKEKNYRITRLGIRAFQNFIISGRKMPKVKDASAHTNDRYLNKSEHE